MKRAASNKLPLFEPWLTWEQLPELTRERALGVLTTLYLETVSLPPILEPDEDDSSNH